MRTKRAIINGISGMMIHLPVILIGLVYQKVFISQLGGTYLGVSGLFTNIISMLSIAELGIGTSIVFHLYYPISINDKQRINELISYYKKCYHVVLVVILIAGLLVMPFIPHIAGEIDITENIYIIYLLFLGDCMSSYCFVYRQSILIADQKNYIVNFGLMLYRSLTYIGQMIYLQFSHNYYGFLAIGIILRLGNNIFLSKIATQKYPMIREHKGYKLSEPEILGDISKKIKASIFHRVGSFIVTGSDNILISLLCGIRAVGAYSNYNMIISALKSIVTQCFTAVTSGVGNMLVSTEKDVQFAVYKKIRYFNYIVAVFVSLCLFGLMDSWINIWIGQSWLLSESILFVLTLNLFLTLMRNTMSIFKDAAGIVYEDRFVPILECLVNLISSLVFFRFYGFAGIFWGTVCSNLILHLYSYPRFVFRRVFQQTYRLYYMTFVKEGLLFFLNLMLLIKVKSEIGQISSHFFMEIVLVVLGISAVLTAESFLFYRDEFKYFRDIFFRKYRN